MFASVRVVVVDAAARLGFVKVECQSELTFVCVCVFALYFLLGGDLRHILTLFTAVGTKQNLVLATSWKCFT